MIMQSRYEVKSMAAETATSTRLGISATKVCGYWRADCPLLLVEAMSDMA